MPDIKIIYGTMGIGVADAEESDKMIKEFIKYGHNEIDTAYMYNGTKTEQILGQNDINGTGCLIATKASPNVGADGVWVPEQKSGLSKELLTMQVEASLKNMKVDSVQILYLHWPDKNINLEETLACVNELHKQGKFKELGLSNYPGWQVFEIYSICKQKGYVLPTVYQGMYNALCRRVEEELFACLRQLNMRFYAYNPLAGGILTGKHAGGDKANATGRFQAGTALGEMYLKRYWDDIYFQGVELVKAACEKNNIKITHASFQWLKYHSGLRDGDAIIIGGSTLPHVTDNLEGCKAGELPIDVQEAFDAAWGKVKGPCPMYHR